MDANTKPVIRRLLIAVAAILFFAASALAQRTVVSGTVKDVNGIPYAGATLVATLSLPVGVSGATLNGAQIGGATQRVTLDSTGSFLMQLPDNNVVQPGGTQWTFNVNISPGAPPPLGTGPQNCSATLTITGASQNISTSFAACPALSNGIGAGVDPAFIGTALTVVTGQPQIVQAFSTQVTSVNPITKPFENPTTQGHTYLVMLRWNGAQTFTSMTTTQSDSFTQIGTTQVTTSAFGSAFNVALFKSVNVTGGLSTTISATFSAAPGFPGMDIIELTPGDVDVSAVATGSGTAINSGNATTVTALDLVIGIGFINVACPATSTCTVGATYTFIRGDNGATAQLSESKVVSAVGTYNATATAPASTDWAMWVVAMKGTPTAPVLANASGTGPFNLGTITGILTPVQFKISGGQITAGQSQISITVIGGAVSNPAWALTSTIDDGKTWSAVPCNDRTTMGVIGSDQVPTYAARCDLSGLMGETGTTFRFGLTQGFGISNLAVWGAI